jgi:hypothetical protein
MQTICLQGPPQTTKAFSIYVKKDVSDFITISLIL